MIAPGPRSLVSTGSSFEREAGYSRAVVVPPFVFVSGTTGYDYASMTMPEGFEAQAENTLDTIARALESAGAGLHDVVRLTCIITDAAHAPLLFPILGRRFGAIRPANTTYVAGLIRPEMKVEIEATALMTQG